MHFPKLPDWLAYGAVVAALLAAASGRQERANAPPPPPPTPLVEGAALGPASPFDPAAVVAIPASAGPAEGAAFSVDESGVWLTARRVVDGCRRPAIVVGDGLGVAAKVRIGARREAAVLLTRGGAPALPLALSAPLRRGARAFHPGFPRGRPGEAASRLLGRQTLPARGRGARAAPVLAWAEAGRTDGLAGSLGGVSGAPALDASGRVIGVTLGETPRRGRIYTTAPETVAAALASLPPLSPAAALEPITPANYGRVSDDLRRSLRVAPVVCLDGGSGSGPA